MNLGGSKEGDQRSVPPSNVAWMGSEILEAPRAIGGHERDYVREFSYFFIYYYYYYCYNNLSENFDRLFKFQRCS